MAVMNGLSEGCQAEVYASVNTRRSLGTTSRKIPGLGNSFPSGSCIVMQVEPPARTSITALIVLTGGGVNHCVISSGVVQQRYTFSRGALRMRVMTSSRSVGKEVLLSGDMMERIDG